MYLQMFNEGVVEFRRKDLYPLEARVSQDVLNNLIDEAKEKYYANETDEVLKQVEKFKDLPGAFWNIEFVKSNINGFILLDRFDNRYDCIKREWL